MFNRGKTMKKRYALFCIIPYDQQGGWGDLHSLHDDPEVAMYVAVHIPRKGLYSEIVDLSEAKLIAKGTQASDGSTTWKFLNGYALENGDLYTKDMPIFRK